MINQLRTGAKVHTETFDSVTIMFCDIHEFGEHVVSGEIVDVTGILNFIYSLFDQILNDFDVYKVETIGEVYMVNSDIETAK